MRKGNIGLKPRSSFWSKIRDSQYSYLGFAASMMITIVLSIVFFPTAEVNAEVIITPASGSSAPGCEVTVDECYIPNIVTIDIGEKIKFSNSENAAHTFTSGTPSDGPSGEFDSGLVVSGGSFEWMATTTGHVPYFCLVHPWMTGLIIVNQISGSNQTHTASIDISPVGNIWESGKKIPVKLVDGDANRRSKVNDDLDLFDPDVDVIPTLRTGMPITLSSLTAAILDNKPTSFTIQNFSDRALLVTNSQTTINPNDNLTLEFGTWADVFNSTPINSTKFHGFVLFNYDVRALGIYKNTKVSTVDIEFPGMQTFTGKPMKGLILLPSSFGAVSSNKPLVVNFNINTGFPYSIPQNETIPIVADIFGFGFVNDGKEFNERIANQIIRLELEETGRNSSIFAGSIKYTMVNQINILNQTTYTSLSTISNETSFVVMDDWDGDDSPRVYYDDLNEHGVRSPVYAEHATPTHTGIASFTISGDSVVIELEDSDLNTDADLIDRYTVVNEIGDANFDVVGDKTVAHNGTSIAFSNGDQLGRLLDITFDDFLWKTPAIGSTCANELAAANVTETGLGKTNFTLVETSASSGIFVGDFNLPTLWCNPDTSKLEPIREQDVQVNYIDFRDAFGEIIDTKHGDGKKYELQLDYGPVKFPKVFQKTDIIKSISDGETNSYFFLQVRHFLNSTELQKLEDDGITIVDSLNSFVYVVNATKTKLLNFPNATHSEIRAASPIKSEYKKDLRIKPDNIPSWVYKEDDPNTNEHKAVFTIYFFPEISANEMAVKINKDPKETSALEGIHAITALLSFDEIETISKHSAVRFITYPDPPLKAEISEAKRVVSITTEDNQTIDNLTGEGVIAFIFDINAVLEPPVFTDRFERITDPLGSNSFMIGPHSTEVASVLGANGSENKGVAPGVKIFSYDSLSTGSGLWGTVEGDLVKGLKLANQNANTSHKKIGLMNISLGQYISKEYFTPCNLRGNYTQTSYVLDKLVVGYRESTTKLPPVIITKSAGNERKTLDDCVGVIPPSQKSYYTINSPATAKNPIVVGSVDTNREISSFTSFGPTDDGRIKPDLVAPGAHDSLSEPSNIVGINTYTAVQYLGGYISGSTRVWGTSYSSPIVGGLIALMEEKWNLITHDDFGDAIPPHTAKAILIHTADDIDPPGPDYKSGWGMINGKKAIDLIKSATYVNGSSSIPSQINSEQTIIFDKVSNDGGSNKLNKSYSLGTKSIPTELKVTLVWDDVPKAPSYDLNTLESLMNDLDLFLIVDGEDGDKIRGWHLNPDDFEAVAIKSNAVDIKNNVEMIQSVKKGNIDIKIESKLAIPSKQFFTLIVSAIPHSIEHPIDIRPINTQYVNQGDRLEFTANLLSSNPDLPITFSLPVNPSGIASIDNSGKFSWNVLNSQAKGTYDFVIKASNEESFDQESVSVVVNDRSGGCLIATAAYGSEMAPQIQYLREIRDNKLMNTQSGLAFITGFNQFYYSFSPSVADYERENPAFKELIKIGITPMLTSLSILSLADSELEIVGFGIGIILMNIGMYIAMPVYGIIKLKKHFQKKY